MFGRKPRLAIDRLLGGEEVRAVSQGYSKFVESLRKNLQAAYKVAMQGAEKAREVQKRHFDLRARAGTIEVGDRVLVRILAHGGKHKLVDNWERDPYVVLEQPNHDIPVFVVQLENGKGPRRTLHRNHLLSVTTLPMLPQKEPPKVMPRRKRQQVIQEDKVSSAGSVSTKTDVSMMGVLYSVTDDRDTPAVLPGDGTGTISEVTGMQISDNVVESSVSSGEEGDNVSTHSSDLREEYTGEDSEADISLSADEILLSSSLVDSGDTDADIEVSLVAASPSGFVGRQSPPIPAPRRGTRIRRQPEWLRSGDYIVHQTTGC